MRVLITGAAGQLGYDLAQHCSAMGDADVAVDRRAARVDRQASLEAGLGDALGDGFRALEWRFGGAVGHELDGIEQSETTDVAHVGMAHVKLFIRT